MVSGRAVQELEILLHLTLVRIVDVGGILILGHQPHGTFHDVAGEDGEFHVRPDGHGWEQWLCGDVEVREIAHVLRCLAFEAGSVEDGKEMVFHETTPSWVVLQEVETFLDGCGGSPMASQAYFVF